MSWVAHIVPFFHSISNSLLCQEENTACLTPEQQREVGEEVADCAMNLLMVASLEQALSPQDDRRRLLQVMRYTFKVTQLSLS